MKKSQLDSWSSDRMRRQRYMQSIKVTMAYIEKNRNEISRDELWHQLELIIDLIIRVDQIDNPEFYKNIENEIVRITNAN